MTPSEQMAVVEQHVVALAEAWLSESKEVVFEGGAWCDYEGTAVCFGSALDCVLVVAEWETPGEVGDELGALCQLLLAAPSDPKEGAGA